MLNMQQTAMRESPDVNKAPGLPAWPQMWADVLSDSNSLLVLPVSPLNPYLLLSLATVQHTQVSGATSLSVGVLCFHVRG